MAKGTQTRQIGPKNGVGSKHTPGPSQRETGKQCTEGERERRLIISLLRRDGKEISKEGKAQRH